MRSLSFSVQRFRDGSHFLTFQKGPNVLVLKKKKGGGGSPLTRSPLMELVGEV